MSDKDGQKEPKSVPLDLEAQQRDLEAAGWERLYRTGKLLWRHPESGHLYPQGAAVARLGQDRRGEDE